jgi:ADP-ribose pyrophosphatase YjhB (NUDIX family)
MKKIIQPVVVAAIREGDKYLFTFRDDDEGDASSSGYNKVWQLPGGGLEFGESAEACAVREIMEEAGVMIDVVTLVPKLYHDVRNGVWHGLLICFLCKMKNEDAQIVLNHESSDYKWMSYNEVKDQKTLPFTKEIIALAEKI